MNKKLLREMKVETDKYLICEKTDGVRYMLITLSNGMFFLMGRSSNKDSSIKNNYFLTNFSNLPANYYNEENIILPNIDLVNLFDGELVRDEIKGKSHYQYLIFDTIQCGINSYIPKESYDIRLECAKRFIESIKTLKEFDESLNVKKTSLRETILKPFPVVNIKFKDFFKA